MRPRGQPPFKFRSCSLRQLHLLFYLVKMNHSELEQNLLSEKDDFERSEKDDFEGVLLTTWSPRSYRRLLHFRNFLQDLIQSQGQRLIVASLILVNIFFLIYILNTRNHNECYNQSPIGIVLFSFRPT